MLIFTIIVFILICIFTFGLCVYYDFKMNVEQYNDEYAGDDMGFYDYIEYLITKKKS